MSESGLIPHPILAMKFGNDKRLVKVPEGMEKGGEEISQSETLSRGGESASIL